MQAPRGIVFDLDGTLVDTLALVYEAFASILEPFVGARWSPEQIAAHFGPPESQILAKFIPAERLSDETERLYQYYRDHPERVVVFPEIKSLLDELYRGGVRTGLFTGKGREGTRITLDQVGMTGSLADIVTGDDTVCPKPHPEGLLRLIENWRLDPGSVWMVGDTAADVHAGRGAGTVTVGVLWGTHRREALLESAPDFVFETPREFLDFWRSSLS